MITISLCMIVKNEEAVLARCLSSVKKAVDEIIIVDTGSTDTTKAIARRFTNKVFDFKWIDDFSAARNEAFSKATKDFQMWLDADDVFPEEELKKLIELKKVIDTDIDMVTMKYYTHFDAQGNPLNISTRGRLFNRRNGYKWEDPIHEFIALSGRMIHTDIIIHHLRNYKEEQSGRNINVYTTLENSGKEMTPRQLYYFARELRDHGQNAKAIYYFERFLDTKKGWAEDNIATCHALALLYNLLGDKEKVLPILTKAFLYGTPRAEILCEIGYHYKRSGDRKAAYEWFKLGASLGAPETLGFVLRDYWGYIPNIECCVCAYELGDYKAAIDYNERAAEYKPDDPAVEYNRKAFKTLPNENKQQ